MSATPPILAPGARIRGILVGRAIGRGAAAAVFEGRHEATGRPVALKVLDPLQLRDPGARERFEREARVLAALDHPNVARVLDAGVELGLPFIAVELLGGGSLEERIRRDGPLGWREAARLAAGVARGLSEVHAAGLVHRDVKPANVVLDERGTPKLVDFGLARRSASGLDSMTATGEVLGTLEYVAPEQAESGQPASGAADLYALGGTLHAVLTGRPPFEGAGLGLLEKHARAPRPSVRAAVPAIPAALDALVRRLLDPDPAKRGEARAVAGELEAIASSAPARSRAAWAIALVALAIPGVALALRPPGPALEPGWRVAWTLGEGAPPALERPALWEGLVAAPLRGVAADDAALAAAFDGGAQRAGNGRVRVVYSSPGSLHPRYRYPSGFFAHGTAEAGLVKLVDGALVVDVPDDTHPVDVQLGRATWRDAALRFGARLEVRGNEYGSLNARVGEVDEIPAFSVIRRTRHLVLVRQLPWPTDDGWHDYVVDPCAARGARVTVDGRLVPELDPESWRGRVGAVFLVGTEGVFSFRAPAVEGVPLRADRPARAIVPGPPLPSSARIEATFAISPVASAGGPFVALGEGDAAVTLELVDGRAVLAQGEDQLGTVAVATGDRVRLLLEKRGDVLRATATVGDATATIEEALPFAIGRVQATFGSTGAPARVEEARALAGPDDSARSAFDAAGDATTAAARGATGGTPAEQWRLGALLLARASSALRLDRAIAGDLAARNALAAAARDRLVPAARTLARRSPERADALVRACFAAVLSGDGALARELYAHLVDERGPAAARARLEALESVRGRGALFDRLKHGYQMDPQQDPAVAWAAVALASAAALSRTDRAYAESGAAQLESTRARALLSARDPAGLDAYRKAARAFEQVLETEGLDAELRLKVNRELPHCYTALGQPERALRCWEHVVSRVPEEYYPWLMGACTLLDLGRPSDGFEWIACVIACVGADKVPDYARAGLDRYRQTHASSLALLELVSAWKTNLASASAALDVVRRMTPPDDRSRSHAAYVIACHGEDPRVPEGSDLPLDALARARWAHGRGAAARDREALGAAAARSPVARTIARLDPVLRSWLETP